jgi:spoIIIJ-associated protein
MNARTTLEIIAPTVEEAIAQGLAQLGLTADAVRVEVLDAGSKGLFGFGRTQVRVRLTVNEPAQEAALEAVPAPASESEAVAESAPVAEAQPLHDPLLDQAKDVVSKLLHLMGLEAQVSAHFAETDRPDRRSINVDVRGNDLSVLIGRRSETLDAFQYVASLILGKLTAQFVLLVVDVEGYRGRRERQLIQMAKRMAEQVVKNKRKQTLEPMSAAERRIIHLALRDHPAVTTESSGEEPYRKVVIYPKEK